MHFHKYQKCKSRTFPPLKLFWMNTKIACHCNTCPRKWYFIHWWKNNCLKFYVCYMKEKTLKEHITLQDQTIQIMSSEFSINTIKCIKRPLIKNVTVILMIMFYEHRDTIMFRVSGYVIFTILDNFTCLYHLCLLQDKL